MKAVAVKKERRVRTKGKLQVSRKWAHCGATVAARAIAGYYTDINRVLHGFLRAPDGTIISFDPPGSVSTFPQSINPAGAITGGYTDKSFVTHGFLRIRCERDEDGKCERDEDGENNCFCDPGNGK